MERQGLKIREIYEKLEAYDKQTVTVEGWAKTIRDQKAFAFIHLSDGSQFKPIQLVVNREAVDNYDLVVRAGTSAAFRVSGILHVTPEAKQACEIEVTSIEVVGESPADYPLQPKRHSPEFLRTIPHLRPRTNLFQAVFRLRSETAYAIHEFFHERAFVYVHTPILTGNDAEGAGEMFRVTNFDLGQPPRTDSGEIDYHEDFFAKPMMLTVTGQLHVEAFAQSFGNVYTFGPTFRAEHSNTPRHAAEFWMIEPEIAFADLEDNMNLAEDMMAFVLDKVLHRCPQELEFLNQFVDKTLIKRLETQSKAKFEKISYTDAIKLLEKENHRFKYPVSWGCDLQTEHERFLTEELFHSPVFVRDYPAEIKAFYMRLNEDGKTVAAMDGLVPGVGELIGGSQREERADYLDAMIRKKGLEPADYAWYQILRRYGSTKHAGYGVGFERLLMYLSGVNNIRDVLPYPRTTGQALY
ncbi:MAG: asparagine--tRNA ligase [Eubacteriales bacterium]|nr:asparagine--tRNA ligase [Eubacteriales bacterium]